MKRIQILFLGTRMLAFNKALILSRVEAEEVVSLAGSAVMTPVPLFVMISGWVCDA